MFDEDKPSDPTFSTDFVESFTSTNQSRANTGENQDQKEKEADMGAFNRKEGAHQEEISQDPEKVVIKVRSSIKWTLLEILAILSFVSIFSVSFALYLSENTVFGVYFSMYKYKYFLFLVGIVPPIAMVVWRIKIYYLRIVSSFEVSRRFITSSIFKLLYFQTDTCDLTNVIDITIKNFGPVSTIILLTDDASCPRMQMNFIASKDAKELVGFVRAHAANTYVEMRTSRKNNEF